MGEELERADAKWYENVSLKEAKTYIQANIQNIDRSMKTIGRSVIAVGYYLKCVRDGELYREDGYSNIWDFADQELEISKSAASRYMKMNDRYSVDGNSPIVAEQFREFGKSQLQEMLYLTDEQIEEVTPDSTVAQIRELRQPAETTEPQTEEQIPGQQDLERDYPDWCPSGGCATVSMEDFGVSSEPAESTEPAEKERYTVAVGDLVEPEPVATSQQSGMCIHRPQFKCSLDDADKQTPGDGENCIRKCCWNCTKRGECRIECYSSAGRPKEDAALSPYGTPQRTYQKGSLIKTEGCDGGHDCFQCSMECNIRQKDRYCREATLGDPFPCEIVKGGFSDLPDTCQFRNHELADHFAGSGEANPCCKNCEDPCEYICGRAMRAREQRETSAAAVDVEFQEVTQLEDTEPSDMELLKEMLCEEKKDMEEMVKVNQVEPSPCLDRMIRKQKIIVKALELLLEKFKEETECS